MNLAQAFLLTRGLSSSLGSQALCSAGGCITKPSHSTAHLSIICKGRGSSTDEQPARHQHASQLCSTEMLEFCIYPPLLPTANFPPLTSPVSVKRIFASLILLRTTFWLCLLQIFLFSVTLLTPPEKGWDQMIILNLNLLPDPTC